MSTKMSKLSFRAKPLDASKPMPVYINEELPGLPDYSAINRAVPQMPSGMHKEEECEHHLQRAICTGLIIPTPECTDVSDEVAYDRLYPSNFKTPRQLIHMQSFAMDQDIPDYDMDSEDELWFSSQKSKLKITPEKFEEMMDRLEKGLGQTVLSEQQAKALLKDDDDVILAVYDYWLNKRLKTQYPLIPAVRTEHHPGTAPDNPYIAFRRRTEKMQTRKHRKNDETSYEKMLKLKRDLSRAVTLLELIKRREKTKREVLHLTVEVFEKRYQAGDFSGQMLAEVSAVKPCPRPAFAPLFPNQFSVNHQNWPPKEEPLPRKEKRPYKKRKHKTPLGALAVGSGTGLGGRSSISSATSVTAGLNSSGIGSESLDLDLSSDDEVSSGLLSAAAVSDDDSGTDGSDGPFVFRRRRNCSYHAPLAEGQGNWPWCSREEGGLADRRYRFCLTSLATPPPGRCVGFSRRRVGRGGRVVLDRVATPMDDVFSSFDFTIFDSDGEYSRPRPVRRYRHPLRRVSQGKSIPKIAQQKPEEVEEPPVSTSQENQETQIESKDVKQDQGSFKYQHSDSVDIEVKKLSENKIKLTHNVASDTKVEAKGHAYERHLDQQYQNVSGTQEVSRATYEKYTAPELQNTQPDQGSSQQTTEEQPAIQQILEEFDNTEFLNEVSSEWLHFRPMPANNTASSEAASSADQETVLDWSNSNSLIDWSGLRFDFESPNGGPPTEMSFLDIFCNMPGGPMDPTFLGLPSDFDLMSRWGIPTDSAEDAGARQSNAEMGGSSSSALLQKNDADDDKYQVGCSKFIVHSGPSMPKTSPPQLWANISSSLHQAPGPGRPGGTTSNRTAHQHRKRERHHQHSQNYSFYNAAGTTSSPSNPPLSNGVSIIPVSVSAVLSANPGLLRQGLSNGPAGPSSGTVVSSSSRRRAIPVFIKQEVVEEATDLNEQFNCSAVAAAAAAAAAAACSEQQKLKSSTTSQQQVLMEVT